jgi:hypothetical protein
MQRRNSAIPKCEFMLMLRLGSLHLCAESRHLELVSDWQSSTRMRQSGLIFRFPKPRYSPGSIIGLAHNGIGLNG